MTKLASVILIFIFSAIALWSGWLLWTFGAFDGPVITEKTAGILFFGSILLIFVILVSFSGSPDEDK